MTGKPKQTSTCPTTAREIMTGSDAFAAGVADVRAGRGFRRSYESPRWGMGVANHSIRSIMRGAGSPANWQWNYERGRQWAIIAGPAVALTDEAGRLNPEAVKIFKRAGDDIR